MASPRSLHGLVAAKRRWLLVLMPALFVTAAAIALSVDCSLSQWVLGDDPPDFLQELCSVVEPFGHGIGVIIIAVAIFQLDPRRRWGIPRLLIMSLAAGMAANGIKALVSRVRPHHFDFAGGVWASFGELLPLAGAGPEGQSFPSAHTATAVGLAMALVWLYPRGRWLFPMLAALVACQRIVSGAHFLSDVLFGAALGYMVGIASLWPSRATAVYDRLELALQRWGSDVQAPATASAIGARETDGEPATPDTEPAVYRRAA